MSLIIMFHKWKRLYMIMLIFVGNLNSSFRKTYDDSYAQSFVPENDVNV